jgi:uncharacterized membrane protein YkoI
MSSLFQAGCSHSERNLIFIDCCWIIVIHLATPQFRETELVCARGPVMTHCKTVLAALSSAFFTMAVPAIAAHVPPHDPVATLEASTEQSKTSLLAFDQAKISLQDAISATESSLGGIVISAEFQISNGSPVYVVKTSRAWDKSVCEETVDARTGNVITKDKAVPEARLDQRARLMLASLHDWFASLGEAVVAAKDSSGGKPISAHLVERDGAPFFQVTLVKGASTVNVVVDAKDGHVAS